MKKITKMNTAGSSTGQRVRALRERLGKTQAELAARMCFSRNYISIIENGREPSHRFLRALELLEKAPFPYIEHPATSVVKDELGGVPHDGIAEPGLMTRVIPLLSWAQAGTAQAWENLDAHEGFVGFNVRDSKAVAIRIRGDGMAPDFPHGTIAVVYPGWEAKSGDLVIARLKDGTVMFKRFHVDGNHYTFISLNPLYPPQTVDKSKVEKVLPVGSTFQSHL
jgi:SOS-response transcriptional repressor LexA